MSRPKIAVGGIFMEANHLGGRPTDLACFARSELRRGDDVLAAGGSYLGGMLAGLRAADAKALPLVYASANAGGPITEACYHQLKRELLDALASRDQVDGVLLSLHGSASAEGCGDVEGDLIQAVRAIVGDAVPVLATLDLHAHITARMVEHADALVAVQTYPHVDTYETGQRAAALLIDTLAGRVQPVMAMAKVPLLVGGVNGSTEGDGPFAQVMRRARALEDDPRVLRAGAILVQPHLDLPDLGGGGLVVTDGDAQLAQRLAADIAVDYWLRRFELEPEAIDPAAAIARGLALPGRPVLLVDTADCAGGGAAGDSAAALRALLDAGLDEPALVPVVDPQAAAACHAQGAGATVTLRLGHHLDQRWGEPVEVTGRVLRVLDGGFTYSGGTWAQVRGDMGPSAVLQVGAVRVLIMTHATYDWADEQFRAAGCDVRAAKFVVVKNPMNYRLGYDGIAAAALLLDTPGPTPATVRHVRYERMQRPYFPADSEIPGLTPTVLRSRDRGPQRGYHA